MIGQGKLDADRMWELMLEDPNFVIKHSSGTVSTNIFVMKKGGGFDEMLKKFNLENEQA